MTELRRRSFVDKPPLFDLIDLKEFLLNGKESSPSTALAVLCAV